MCSRYGSSAEFNLLEKTYKIKHWPENLELSEKTIYPHTPAPVIVNLENQRALRLMNFSLVPAWSKEKKPKFATYNARIEEILNKPTWRDPFRKTHCLVPISYFIESVYEGPFSGHNISISSHDHHLLTAAGIWETWVDKSTGEALDSFAILTTAPPKEILDAGHDRSPIFLNEESFEAWLTGKLEGTRAIDFLLSHQEKRHFEFKQLNALKGK